ncbi:MAG: hypothetical protein CUN52_12390, partial [Phototrophicales bacterium]
KTDTQSWDLFMLDMRVGVTIRLTESRFINERYPKWSSDGQYIAYHANSRESNLYDIHITSVNNPNTSTKPFITDSNMGAFAIAYDKAMPAWSWDDRQLGFHAKTDTGYYGLFIGNADGTQLHMVINPPGRGDVLHFAWSPNNTQIAFTQRTTDRINIYLLTLPEQIQFASTNRANMQLLAEDASFPAWSPDGTKIAYVHQFADAQTIWIYDITNQLHYPLTDTTVPGKTHLHPAWSSDSEYIIFASDHANSLAQKFNLYRIRVDGHELHQLTFGTENTLAPDWTD